MPTTPQDHKSKAPAKFTFSAGGKNYTLPFPDEKTAAAIPGGLTMDAILEPDNVEVQMRLGFATLQAVKPSDAAMAAFRSLGSEEMLDVLGRWMGESSGSSD